MALYTIDALPPLREPVMLLALTGWVDAAGAGTDAAEWFAGDGRVLVSFKPDELFDYRSNRPVIRFENGRMEQVSWPHLWLQHRPMEERDVVVLTGNEPDLRWQQLAEEVADLAQQLGVRQLITLGAIPAAVPHTLPPPVLTTVSEPDLASDDDMVISGTLVVPGAAVSILSEAVREAGIPTIGYYAQVPHYVGHPYYPAVAALVRKVARRAGVATDVAELETNAAEQRVRLDAAVAEQPEGRALIQRLEEVATEGLLPSGDELASEVERWLREFGGGNGRNESGDSPFGG